MIELEFQKVSEDVRGMIYILKHEGKEIANFDGFNAGAPRGGHYHSNPERKTVIFGELEYWRVNPRNIDNEIRSFVRKNDVIDIEPEMAHLFIAKTDALLFGTRNGEFEATVYSPYRKIVEDFLAKHKE